MTAEEKSKKTPEELLEYYSGRLLTHLSGGKPLPGRARIMRWTIGVTHAAYTLHPELRVENSLPRFFVARAGRKMGFRGEDLTWFVESAYQSGKWQQFVPEGILRAHGF